MNSFVTLSSTDDKVRATKFESGGVSDNDPFSQSRRIAYDDKRTRAGTVTFDGSKTIEKYPHWELLIVTEGSLNFTFATTEVNVSAGGALVVNKATRFRITADASAKWVFLSVTTDLDGNPEPAVLNFFDRDAPLFESPTLDADILVSSPPTCRNHRMHVRDDIRVRAGVWDSTPYERVYLEQKEHELMHITQGEVTFSDNEGRDEVYSVGDTFLVPKGVHGKWKSTAHVAKIYAVVS
ncbi:MAG TPA: cupin domain-containing protein [Woeseiaceae bacterium]|nr:cupin domain-containing protein [Woeseiaceae bacterium]